MSSAYIDGLKMLGRRELSEKQVRQRLARKEHEPDEIEDAVTRLREERAINDVRVAEAIARTETGIRKRGAFQLHAHTDLAALADAGLRPRDRLGDADVVDRPLVAQARDRFLDVVGFVFLAGEALADLLLGQLAPSEHLQAVDVGGGHGCVTPG